MLLFTQGGHCCGKEECCGSKRLTFLEEQEIDAPDVFTDQPHILAVTLAGTAAHGGLVDPQEMLMLQLDFHCYQVKGGKVEGQGSWRGSGVVEKVGRGGRGRGRCRRTAQALSHGGRRCGTAKERGLTGRGWLGQTGLADVHVEISFANQYYPCDFAFTYECGMGGSFSEGSSAGSVLFMVARLPLLPLARGRAVQCSFFSARL